MYVHIGVLYYLGKENNTKGVEYLLKRKVIILKLQKICSRKIVKNGNAKTISIPPQWGEVGERVSVVVRDKSTLVVTKKV